MSIWRRRKQLPALRWEDEALLSLATLKTLADPGNAQSETQRQELEQILTKLSDAERELTHLISPRVVRPDENTPGLVTNIRRTNALRDLLGDGLPSRDKYHGWQEVTGPFHKMRADAARDIRIIGELGSHDPILRHFEASRDELRANQALLLHRTPGATLAKSALKPAPGSHHHGSPGSREHRVGFSWGNTVAD
ncbi:MAG: hypothetical protein HOQ05_10595, partial [Corynebacteriales bacterium]|nr:hypothetical protein [Mycobacteriales bacterium]